MRRTELPLPASSHMTGFVTAYVAAIEDRGGIPWSSRLRLVAEVIVAELEALPVLETKEINAQPNFGKVGLTPELIEACATKELQNMDGRGLLRHLAEWLENEAIAFLADEMEEGEPQRHREALRSLVLALTKLIQSRGSLTTIWPNPNIEKTRESVELYERVLICLYLMHSHAIISCSLDDTVEYKSAAASALGYINTQKVPALLKECVTIIKYRVEDYFNYPWV